jgi:hypothetical protein
VREWEVRDDPFLLGQVTGVIADVSLMPLSCEIVTAFGLAVVPLMFWSCEIITAFGLAVVPDVHKIPVWCCVRWKWRPFC